jgi:SAM-dependent methyltransferase
MSSPIAKTNKTGLDKALVASHQRLSHSHRIGVLVELLSRRIRELGLPSPVRVLDVGCGDMTLAKGLMMQIDDLDISCVDIHPPPADLPGRDAFWARYRQFDGQALPFAEQSFDIVIFSDVLHHVPVKSLQPLLASAGRVGRYVLIKDHFEYGWFSRQALRAMDFVGNYAYGISVPARYFSVDSFSQALDAAGLQAQKLDIGLRLYDHLPLVRSLLPPRWQFLATCAGATSLPRRPA